MASIGSEGVRANATPDMLNPTSPPIVPLSPTPDFTFKRQPVLGGARIVRIRLCLEVRLSIPGDKGSASFLARVDATVSQMKTGAQWGALIACESGTKIPQVWFSNR